MIAGGDGRVDARSLRWQLDRRLRRDAAHPVPSVPRWTGDPSRHTLYLLTLPVSVVLLAAYLFITIRNLRIHRSADREEPKEGSWSLGKSLGWLSAATAATAIVSEILVHSLEDFGHAVGLKEFFIAAVIVAIVGNAAEHGGAIVIAHRGNTELATEIAISSSMQVAVFVAPAVALLSWIVGEACRCRSASSRW